MAILSEMTAKDHNVRTEVLVLEYALDINVRSSVLQNLTV